MKVIVGNDSAYEGYRDPASLDPDKVRLRSLDGQRTTMFLFPVEIGIMDAARDLIITLPYHMSGAPQWVESDDPTLLGILAGHFGIPDKRPKLWGESDEIVEAAVENTEKRTTKRASARKAGAS